MNNIRNFCIIAHIDHGKTTLANSLLELTKNIKKNVNESRFFDDMDIERERGITIKSHPIQMEYLYKGCKYILNLIDTPGHVDFSYEVYRSIYACEGAILVIDATKGIQSQTISNVQLALSNNLKIIPVINKIDLNVDLNNIIEDIIELIKCKKNNIILVSAKKNIGINKILDSIILNIPPPLGDIEKPLQALIFDSIYNSFRGVEIFFKIKNGKIYKGQKLKFMLSNKYCNADEIGILNLNKIPKEIMYAGEVGYLISGVKNIFKIKIGDTLTSVKNPSLNLIKSFKKTKPMVFAGIYPINSIDYDELKKSIEKLKLNDSSLVFKTETSSALGYGFRCGFLGMLHMEIFQERLEREYGISVITTIPSVPYNIFLKKNPKKSILIDNPSDYLDNMILDRIEEPYVEACISTTIDYIGPIISLCMKKRGVVKNQNYLNNKKVELIFEFPLTETVFDFYNNLKIVSKGYASFDYKYIEYRPSKLVKVNIFINDKIVDALSFIVHISNSFYTAKNVCKKLSKLIPKKQFEIKIQAIIKNKIIARETIKSFRKNVISKCYGGDISRKKKLLEKQKHGKKKMRHIGNVEIPQSAFIDVLKLSN